MNRLRCLTQELKKLSCFSNDFFPENEANPQGLVSQIQTLLQWNLDLTNLYITNDILPSALKMYGKEPRYNEVLGITNDILQYGLLKCMEQNLDTTNQFPYGPLALR